MASVKDWMSDAAAELRGETVHSSIVAVIEKHCPFKPGVAYEPVVSETQEYLLQRFGLSRSGELPTRLPHMSRNHLPLLCRELGFTRGAEIGVWKGAYAASFCAASPAMHMLCVEHCNGISRPTAWGANSGETESLDGR